MFMDVLTEGESTPRLLKRGSKGAHGHSLPKRQAADDFSSPASAWTVLAAGDPRGLSREGRGPTAHGGRGLRLALGLRLQLGLRLGQPGPPGPPGH